MKRTSRRSSDDYSSTKKRSSHRKDSASPRRSSADKCNSIERLKYYIASRKRDEKREDKRDEKRDAKSRKDRSRSKSSVSSYSDGKEAEEVKAILKDPVIVDIVQ
jgi:hypothetical protein